MSVGRFGVLAGVLGMLLAVSAVGSPVAAAEEPDPVELTSSPTASLTIAKDAVPLAGGVATVFAFDGTLGGFTLGDGESITFAELAPGDYTVSEILPAGWVFDGVTCLGVEPVVSVTSMTISLLQGQPAACTFASHQERVAGPGASLTVIEQTTPAGGEGFGFDVGALGTFTLADGESRVFGDLAAGTYVVSQADPAAEWPLRSVECTAGEHLVAGGSVTLNLSEGEAAVCTFVNGSGELPQTGLGEFLLPLLIAGVWVLLLGLGVVVWPWTRKVDAR